MSLTFEQKRHLLEYLADESRWYFRDITDILLDPRRKETVKYGNDQEKKAADASRNSDDEPSKEDVFQPGLWSAEFNKVAEFRFEEWPDMKWWELVNNAKLVIAFDLAVEPSLHAVNEWKIKGEDGEYKMVEKPWTDTTEFKGHYVHTASRFTIEAMKDGFKLATNVDTQRWIRDQANLMKLATEQDEASGFNATLNSMADLGTLLQTSPQAEMPSGRTFYYAVIETPEAGKQARAMRDFLHNTLHLPNDHAGVVAIDEDSVLVSAEEHVLDNALSARAATLEFIEVAKSGKLPHGQSIPEFLEDMKQRGADLKYVDPEAAAHGSTLGNILLEHERFEILSAMKKGDGLHDLNYKPPAPD